MLQNVKDNNEYDILLHACCGVCAGYPIKKLKSEGLNPLLLFSNDNIDSLEEYNKRAEAFMQVCNYFNVDYIVDDYSPETYLNCVQGLEFEPERGNRCSECFRLRLRKSADFAIKIGIDKFTSTLAISPHKNYNKITLIGQEVATELGLEYVGIDFKKGDGFLKTNQISKELNLYRQNYCGCKFAKSHLKEG